MLVIPVFFLGGYFFFATRWVPRIILTLKARSWLIDFRIFPLGGLFLDQGWPEVFMMFVQFFGLIYLISTLSLVGKISEGHRLSFLSSFLPARSTYDGTRGSPVEDFFLSWRFHREVLLFRPSATRLIHTMDFLFGRFSFYSPGKQFPSLLAQLQERFSRETRNLNFSNGILRG